MTSLNAGKIILWSIWTHLFVPLLGAFTISVLIGTVAYCLIRARGRRQIELQKLKAQVDSVEERLRTLHDVPVALPIELSGLGPFELPPLNRLSWLIPNENDGVKAGFVSQEGKRIYATIVYLAVAQLLNDFRAAPLEKKTFLPTVSIDLEKPADAYELPSFPRFEGHYDQGRISRILVFSAKDGRKVLLPLSFETYKELLAQSKAALKSYREDKCLREII